MLELDELKALVHASPVYHQQYLLDRKYLLFKCIETSFPNFVIDVCLVHSSGSPDFSKTRTTTNTTQLLNSYRSQQSSVKSASVGDDLSLEDATSIAAFHFSIVNPLAKQYVAWALEHLAKATSTSITPNPKLSNTEKVRLYRAFYRFQLFCNLFGAGRYLSPGRLRLNFDAVDILDLFICIYEPWEVEEIFCVYAFAKFKYNKVFDDISWDVDEKNPKFDGQRPPTPEGAFDLGNSWIRDGLLKGTISRGLELLHIVLFKINNHADMVSLMQEQITWPPCACLEGEILGESAQIERRRQNASGRDLMQQQREPLPFRGDVEIAKGDNGQFYPPLAWTIMWRGTYSNLYGYYIQNVIRNWGYVMWDQARIESTGARELLVEQWEEDWGDTDPRDDLM